MVAIIITSGYYQYCCFDYGQLSITTTNTTGVCEKSSSGEEDTWDGKLSEHQLWGRIAVSAAGRQCKGFHKRNMKAHKAVQRQCKGLRKGNLRAHNEAQRQCKGLHKREFLSHIGIISLSCALSLRAWVAGPLTKAVLQRSPGQSFGWPGALNP